MKFENEEKIKFIRQRLISKLDLSNNLTKDEFFNFCTKLTGILRQNRRIKILKRDINEIKKDIDSLITFLSNIGFSENEMIEVLYKNFTLLDIVNNGDLLNKYILLTVVENEANTVRKDVLLNNPTLFNNSLEEMYARYSILKQLKREISIDSIINNVYNSFIKTFVSNSYINRSYNSNKMNYKIFSEKLDKETFIKRYPINYDVIEELKKDSRNKNVILNGSLSKEEKVKLAIDNYYKVNNLRELEELLNISDSSLQRYLSDDAKKYISKEEYLKIKEWLINAKKTGLSKGGKVSQEKYGFSKDESGHFNGKGK